MRDPGKYAVQPEKKPEAKEQEQEQVLAAAQDDEDDGSVTSEAEQQHLWELIGQRWKPIEAEECKTVAPSKHASKLESRHMLQLLHNEKVLPVVVGQMATARRVASLGPMLQHLAAGNGAVTHHISVIVARGIVDAEYDRLRPYFEAAGVLMDIDDAIKGARRRAVMTAVLAAMHSQRKYIRATEQAIEWLLELVRKHDAAREWVIDPQNLPSLRWIEEWIRRHIGLPYYEKPPATSKLYKNRDAVRSDKTQHKKNQKEHLASYVRKMLAGDEIPKPPPKRMQTAVTTHGRQPIDTWYVWPDKRLYTLTQIKF